MIKSWNRKQETGLSGESLGGSWACLQWGLQLSAVQWPQHSLCTWLAAGKEEAKEAGRESAKGIWTRMTRRQGEGVGLMSREHPCRADSASWILSCERHWMLYLELGQKRLGYLAEAYTVTEEPKSSPSSLTARSMLLTTILY